MVHYREDWEGQVELGGDAEEEVNQVNVTKHHY